MCFCNEPLVLTGLEYNAKQEEKGVFCLAMTTQRRHLLHVFPSFVVGGSQTRFAQLAAAHGDHYRHTVVSLDGTRDMADRIGAGIECVPALYDKRRGLLNLPTIRRMLRQYRPDVLVTYNWGAIDWALANLLSPIARHVHIEDGFGPDEADGQLARRVWTRRIALRRPNTTIVLPSRLLERLAREVWRLPATRIVYVPNGVDCARFSAASSDRPKTPLVIGTVASLRREKNLHRLIKVFEGVAAGFPPDALELVIVGDGPERQALEAAARASACAAQIRFTGATQTPERELATMDIFALSSDTEQMPLSILEAMASGLAIAAIGVGDVPDMVAPQNRPYVTQPGDEAGLRTSLQCLIKDAALRQSLGVANRQAARDRFDQHLMIRRYREIFG
jgi:glycosyltransferase involved in cell wall biosynthesis